jgi:polyisoprenoid-binding protein YceI
LSRLRWLAAALALPVLALAGGFAYFALAGGDAPPPPALGPAAPGSLPRGPAVLRVLPSGGTFVGYRVREEYATIGVRDAVGRTAGVSGTVRIDGARVTAATLEADMASLRSDQAQRDGALRERAIETDRFPRASFRLSRPVALSRDGATAAGELTLHGVTAPVRVLVAGQRGAGGTVELTGSARVDFRRFRIRPPSVAGIVTVQDHGLLEFRLRLAAA